MDKLTNHAPNRTINYHFFSIVITSRIQCFIISKARCLSTVYWRAFVVTYFLQKKKLENHRHFVKDFNHSVNVPLTYSHIVIVKKNIQLLHYCFQSLWNDGIRFSLLNWQCLDRLQQTLFLTLLSSFGVCFFIVTCKYSRPKRTQP